MKFNDKREKNIKSQIRTNLVSIKKHAPNQSNKEIKKKLKMSTINSAFEISSSYSKKESDISKINKNVIKKKITKLHPEVSCTQKSKMAVKGAQKSRKKTLKQGTKPSKKSFAKQDLEVKSSNNDESSEEESEQDNEKMNEEYKPGMLSDLIQIKTYGRVIVPWDPSFGLDPKCMRITEENSTLPPELLKINPAFDLSKRNNHTESTAQNSGNKVFVGNLPSGTSVFDLKKLFKKCGLIHKVKIMNILNKHFKKLGPEDRKKAREVQFINAYITFKTLESCESALKMNGRLYKTHHIRVNFASGRDGLKENLGRTIFVGNLSYGAQDDDLWRVFRDCGLIESVRIVRDRFSGRAKGFAYVVFESVEAADKAVKLDGQVVLDRPLRVFKSSVGAVSLSNLETVKRRNVMKKKKKTVSSSETNIESLKKKPRPMHEAALKPKRKQGSTSRQGISSPPVKKLKKILDKMLYKNDTKLQKKLKPAV